MQNNETRKNISMKPIFILRFGFILFFVILMVVLIVVSIMGVRNTKDSVSLLNEEKSMYYSAKAAHYKWATDLLMAINYGTEFKGSLDPTQCEFGKYINSDEVQNNSDYDEFLNKISPTHSEIHLSAQSLIDTSKVNKEAAQLTFKDTIAPKIETLENDIDYFISEKNTEINNEEGNLDNVINIALIVCSLSVLAIIIACIGTYLFIQKEVIKPLRALDEETKKLSNGELSLNFNIKNKTREMNNLSSSLDISVKELKKYIQVIEFAMTSFADGNFSVTCPITFLGDFATIQTAIEKFQDVISSALSQVNQVSSQVLSGSEQVSSGAQALAQGATQQASSVEQLSASLTEISHQVKQNADNSTMANKVADDATNVISASNLHMQNLMDAMNTINDKSNEISMIIKAIEDIALQTNILALNAAVEAAKAGSIGKGFAVVAAEVRNLAEKSEEAAKNTTELIESSVKSISQGVSLAKTTANDLLEAVSSVNKTTEIISEITKASNEQSISIQQVTMGVNQISAVVQTNSATSEESAAASEELSSQANLLENLVSKFKIKDA